MEHVFKHAQQASDVATTLSKKTQDFANQEQYRRDEAEDLRILHDAQEEEIERLRKEVDDAQ
jgi:hypothetical protein